MVNNKFNKFLTALLLLITIIALGIIGYLGYGIIKKHKINSTADNIIDDFDESIVEIDVGPNEVDENPGEVNENEESNNEEENEKSSSSSKKSSKGKSNSTSGISYEGYNIVGKIRIPKTGIQYPIIDEATVSSMQISVGIIYGPGLNRVGNTVLMGHNYKNGTFFSDNDELEEGDVIYITDSNGRRRRYIIYNKYITSPSDFEYAVRDTAGKREITLASCTNDSKNRIIIWAKEG